MVYIEPKNPVTPEQMENGVLYFSAQAKRQMTPILVPMLQRGNVPGTRHVRSGLPGARKGAQ
jgi:hypothetical protein